MIKERQFGLLIKIIDQYIRTGLPVSSNSLKEDHNLDYSSSTIRSEMVLLEESGYLEKAYKSAGRVPTNKAYELYVENISPKKKYAKDMRVKLSEIFDDRDMNINEVLTASLELISEATNTLSMSNNNIIDSTLEDIRIYKLDNKTAMVMVVLSDGTINKSDIDNSGASFEDMESAINLFANRLVGVKTKDLVTTAIGLKEILSEKVSMMEEQYQSFVNKLFDGIFKIDAEVGGVNTLVEIITEDDKEKAKVIFQYIKDNSIFKMLKKTKNIEKNNTRVYLEFESPEMKEMAVIQKSIGTGNSIKDITLVGKKNQNYEEILDALDALEEEFNNHKE